MSKKSEQKPDIVVLKPVFGLHPGLYLIILFSLAAAAILFAVAFLPGIISYGTRVNFYSNPGGAAVFCDETYIGSGNFDAFIDAGEHTFSFRKPGYNTVIIKEKIKGRLFLSLFFPKKSTVKVDLSINSLNEYLSWRFSELYQWSLIEEYSSNYHYPHLFSDIAEDLVGSNLSSQQTDKAADFMLFGANIIGSEPMYRDYLTALELFEQNTGRSLDPDLLSIILENLYDENPEATFSLENEDTHADFDYTLSRTIEIYSDTFFPVPGGNYLIGDEESISGTSPVPEFPYIVHLEPFYISGKEVTETDFVHFLKENPQWAFENKNQLIENGYVDEFYLLGIDLSDPQEFPIRNISWYAAKAYTEWYSGKLSENGSSFTVSLPTLEQWQAAVSGIDSSLYSEVLTTSRSFPSIPDNMMGNVWEMCDSPFLVSGYGPVDVPDFIPEDAVQRIVMGGSWVNDPKAVSRYTVGSITSSLCSEFIGFRIILLEEE